MGMILKLRQILRLGRDQEGAAAVEFAICLLPLLLILGGIIDFGHCWYMESMLGTASREGARYAARYTTNESGVRVASDWSAVEQYIKEKYALPGLTVTPGGAYTSITAGDKLSVTVAAPKEWFFLGSLGIAGLPENLSSITWTSVE
jgi:Flp pilus assembly protein TadG